MLKNRYKFIFLFVSLSVFYSFLAQAMESSVAAVVVSSEESEVEDAELLALNPQIDKIIADVVYEQLFKREIPPHLRKNALICAREIYDFTNGLLTDGRSLTINFPQFCAFKKDMRSLSMYNFAVVTAVRLSVDEYIKGKENELRCQFEAFRCQAKQYVDDLSLEHVVFYDDFGHFYEEAHRLRQEVQSGRFATKINDAIDACRAFTNQKWQEARQKIFAELPK